MKNKPMYIILLAFAGLLLSPIFKSGYAVSEPAYAHLPSGSAASQNDNAADSSIDEHRNIELVGHLGGMVQSIAVQGSYAYAGFGPELAVLDISNPADIQRVAWLIAPGEVLDIAIQGGLAYIAYRAGDIFPAIGKTGLEVVDIQNPDTPVSLAIKEFGVCGMNARVIVDGSDAYFAFTACEAFGGIIQNAGIEIHRLDVSDPSNPAILNTYTHFMSTVLGLAAQDGWLYVTIQDVASDDLFVFDVSTPTSLEETASLEIPDSSGITLMGDYAFIASGSQGLQVVDVSDPAHPMLAVTHTLPDPVQEIFIDGQTAYLAGQAGMQIVNIADPVHPVDGSTYPTNDPILDLFIAGDHASLANGWGGLEVVQISSLTKAGAVETPQVVNDVIIDNQHAYVAAGDGFWTLDVSIPSMPVAIAHYPTQESCQSLVPAKGYIYLACPDFGLRIMDISNPQTPNQAAVYPLTADLLRVVLLDDKLYVAAGSGGVFILDISSPLAPNEVGHITLGSDGINAVAVAGNYAYLAADNGNMVIFDISSPGVPLEKGSFDPPDRYFGQEASSAQVMDNIVYMSTIEPPPTPLAGFYTGDTWLIDVSNPDTPSLISSIYIGSAPYDISLGDGVAAVAYDREGLRMYDTSNPAVPFEIGAYDPQVYIYGVTLADDLAYIYNDSIFTTQYIGSITRIYIPTILQSLTSSPVLNQEVLK